MDAKADALSRIDTLLGLCEQLDPHAMLVMHAKTGLRRLRRGVEGCETPTAGDMAVLEDHEAMAETYFSGPLY